MIKSSTSYPKAILNIAHSLAEDVEQQIKPHSCVFGPTKGGSLFHYMVRSAGASCKKPSREKLLAWAGVYKIGRTTDIPRRPCLAVSIPCNLLGTAPVVSKLVRTKGGSYGEAGRHECRGVTYAHKDQGYRILLDALTIAAKNWLLHC